MLIATSCSVLIENSVKMKLVINAFLIITRVEPGNLAVRCTYTLNLSVRNVSTASITKVPIAMPPFASAGTSTCKH